MARAVSCASLRPIDHLEDGAVLVAWMNEGAPGRTIAGEPGGAACDDIGGDELITATIDRGASNMLVMRACIRGPSVAAIEGEVRATLDSVKVAPAG